MGTLTQATKNRSKVKAKKAEPSTRKPATSTRVDDPAKYATVARMYNDGKSYAEIAKETKLTGRTESGVWYQVCNYLTRLGKGRVTGPDGKKLVIKRRVQRAAA